MFAVKIFADKKKKNFLEKTIKNLSNFLKKEMSREVNIIIDNASVEMVSGNLNVNNGEIITELLIKKTIVINTADLKDRQRLDEYVREVKHFCKQAVEIEDLKYLPLHFRDRDA